MPRVGYGTQMSSKPLQYQTWESRKTINHQKQMGIQKHDHYSLHRKMEEIFMLHRFGVKAFGMLYGHMCQLMDNG